LVVFKVTIIVTVDLNITAHKDRTK